MHCLRLVSAYQDKVVKNGDAHETWKHWKHWKQSSNDTFTADFVNEVISSVDTGCRYRYINNLNTSILHYYRLTSQNKPEKQGTGDTLYPVLCEEVCIFVFC